MALVVALTSVAEDLSKALRPLRFGAPITHVYDPLDYAWPMHALYLERFGAGPKEAVLIGMNPGPFGMAQTGVPFGEVAMVRDWMRLEAPIGKPAREHPKRKIVGLACDKSEVSGARLWGWARQRFETPDRFFQRFMVLNYCPLVFMEESGKNFTPDKLPSSEREPLFAACDRALRQSVLELSPKVVVGVGVFAAERAKVALAGLDLKIGSILHPSPASPLANKGWAEQAEKGLSALGIR